MKNSIFKNLTLALILFATISNSIAGNDYVPRFAKYPIGTTGCNVYMPTNPGEFSLSKSEDGSEIWIGESKVKEYTFSCICVQLKNEFSTKEEIENVLESYLSFLQKQLGITGTTGVGKGHTLESNPNATGMIDYWEDGSNQYSVKAWGDTKYLGILLLYGPKEYPIFNVQQMFLDGFRFP